MARYHVNPATGEAGACRARPGNCPFSAGSEHYDSVDEARKNYELIMEGKARRPLSWLLSPRGELLSGSQDAASLAQRLHGEYEELLSRISPEEAAHLHNYTLFGFERVNPLLRGTEFPTTAFESKEEALERTWEQIAGLDSVFRQGSQEPRAVYRFTKAPEGLSVREAISRLQEKGEITEEAYVSTSASVDYPLYEILENPKQGLYLLEIAAEGGVAVQPKDRHQPGHVQSMENEVLLPRGLTFEVAGVELRKHVAFGGMKSALLEHANIWTRRNRWQMEERPHHVMPVVKLVQK